MVESRQGLAEILAIALEAVIGAIERINEPEVLVLSHANIRR